MPERIESQIWSARAWVGGAIILACGLGALATYSMIAAVAICGLLTLGVLWATKMSPRYWLLIGVVAVFASSSSFTENPGFSVAVRVIGLSLIIIGGLIAKSSPGALPDRSLSSNYAFVLLPLFAFLAYATIPHGLFLQFAGYSLGIGMLWLALWAANAVRAEHLSFAVQWGLMLIVSGSIIAGFIIPSLAIEGARLRGLTNNANLLGFYSFLLVAILLLGRRQRVRSVLWILLSVIAIFNAASRASMLGVGAILAVGAIVYGGSARRICILIGIAAIPVALIWTEQIAALDLALFRDNNSRDTSISNAWLLFSSHPFSGIGINDELIIASSPLRALAYAGVWGGLCVLLMCIGLLKLSFAASRPAGVLSIAAIVHSLFEGWLLSPVSPLFIVFMLSLMVVARTTSKSSVIGTEYRLQRGLAKPRVSGHEKLPLAATRVPARTRPAGTSAGRPWAETTGR